MEDQGPIGDVVAEREVVGDEEDPEASRPQVGQQVEDVDARRRVEHADDLVGDEEADVEQERPRDQQPLELSAGELVRIAVEHLPGAQPDRRQ